MKKLFHLLLLTVIGLNAQKKEFLPGEFWNDTEGRHIEAHGGGILLYNGTYYWYGEDHRDGVPGGYCGNMRGMPCYSSKDLYNWKFEGFAMPKEYFPVEYQDKGVCQRPKVIYNARTKKFVMWGHFDDLDCDTLTNAGIAISDKPTGPFKMVKVCRPIQYDYGMQDKRRKEDKLGNCYRDMNLFVDDNGKAYTIYASESNRTMYVVRLNDEYTDIERPAILGQTWCRAIPDKYQEAPAVFKYNGKYYMITSAQTGWDPNPSSCYVADNMLGPWQYTGNPWVGTEANTSFRTQSTCVFHAPGKKDNCFIFMSDRWNGQKLMDSRHIWQPLVIRKDGTFDVNFYPRWNLSIFDRVEDNASLAAPKITLTGKTLQWDAVENACSYRILCNGKLNGITTDLSYMLPLQLAGQAFAYSVQAMKADGTPSSCSNNIVYLWNEPVDCYLSDYPYISGSVGYRDLQIDKPIFGFQFEIGDKVCTKGFGTHAPSEITYYLNSRYSRLSATIGIQKMTTNKEKASVVYKVYGDNILLYQSDLIKSDTPARTIEFSILNVNELKLVVTDGGDSKDYDWANWCDVRLWK